LKLELPSVLVCASEKLASPGFFTNSSTLATPSSGGIRGVRVDRDRAGVVELR